MTPEQLTEAVRKHAKTVLQPSVAQAIIEELAHEQLARHEPPFKCKYCWSLSWIDPSEQSLPPDYCHESDHGEPPE